MPVKTISNGMRLLYITIMAIIGCAAGAILLGGFSSISLSILGGVLGLIAGILLGKYMRWYDWF